MSHVTLGVTVGHTTDKQIEVQGLLHPTVHWTHGGNVASLDCEVHPKAVVVVLCVRLYVICQTRA